MIRTFFIRIILFAIPLTVLFFIGLCLPTTPHSFSSFLFEQIRKDSLLRHAPEPRMIFIGGSNLTYGLHSQMLKDSLHFNPVNAALAFQLGLEYMLDHTWPFVKAGDIVILIPEYDLFYGDSYKGFGELPVRMLGEVSKDWQSLRLKHLQYLPKIAFSRFDPRQYLHLPIDSMRTPAAFNQYGDVYLHWSRPNKQVKPGSIRTANQKINPIAIHKMQNFSDSLAVRGARMFVSYPSFMESSFRYNEAAIRLIEAAYKQVGFHVLGTPDRYMIPDSLMFDMHYHPGKQGVDLRTQLLINDLKFLTMQDNEHK
ncbi:MAG: hypothetical protein LBD21_08610 [Tannerellaceae bacterium]|jgi:hypothetical protein|nr:hypothetical protein [Tannerellaceae bacterium]